MAQALVYYGAKCCTTGGWNADGLTVELGDRPPVDSGGWLRAMQNEK